LTPDSLDESPLIRAWMKGARTDVRGDPFEGRSQEGEVMTGRFGVDATLAGGWTIGSALGWHDADLEFDDGAFDTTGAIEVGLWNVTPYVSFARGGLRLWGTLGGGGGTLRYEDSPAGGKRTSTRSDLRLWTGAAGAEYAFGKFGSFDLTGRGEGMIVDLDADGSDHELVGYDGLGATVSGVRGEFEVGLPLHYDGIELRPYGFAGLRWDGGVAGGSALEYGGGFAIRGASLSAEGTVRSQSDGDDDAVELKGFSISLAYDWSNDRRGLGVELERSAGPSDYDPYAAGIVSSLGASAGEATSRLHVGYGLDWKERLLRPYTEIDWRDARRSEVKLGLEYEYSGGSAGLGYRHGDSASVDFEWRYEFAGGSVGLIYRYSDASGGHGGSGLPEYGLLDADIDLDADTDFNADFSHRYGHIPRVHTGIGGNGVELRIRMEF